MTKFTEIPAEEFPLNYENYNDLMDRLRGAARGFADLGTADGALVDRALMEVWAQLNRTWGLIQEIEHRERALQDATSPLACKLNRDRPGHGDPGKALG